MASLQQFPSGNFHIKFDFGGKRFKRSLKTKDKRQAISLRARLEETLRLVELGRIEIPDSVDVPTFLLSDGKVNQKAVIREASLGDLFVRFFDSLPEGTIAFECNITRGKQLSKDSSEGLRYLEIPIAAHCEGTGLFRIE